MLITDNVHRADCKAVTTEDRLATVAPANGITLEFNQSAAVFVRSAQAVPLLTAFAAHASHIIETAQFTEKGEFEDARNHLALILRTAADDLDKIDATDAMNRRAVGR